MTTSFPLTNLTQEAEKLVENILPPYVFNHSKRAYLLAVNYALKNQIKDYDQEALYLATLFHDVGVVQTNAKYSFQINSSRKLQEFLSAKGYPASKINLLVDAIDFHLQLFPRWSKGLEVGLLQVGAWMDVYRLRSGRLKTEIKEFEQQYPRQGMDSLITPAILKTIKNFPSALGLLFPDKYRKN